MHCPIVLAALVLNVHAICNDLNNPATGRSDCPTYRYLCNDATYYTLMTQQCPNTCGRCPAGTATGTANSAASLTCVDKVNPNTGRSDCTTYSYLCNVGTYYTLMTDQCPRTCGRCAGTAAAASGAANSASTSCVDKVNPHTGRSDCTAYSYLCNQSSYYTLMTEQCPRTCGRCASGK